MALKKKKMDESSMNQVRSSRELIDKIERYPALEELFAQYLDIVENTTGDVVKAGEAEEQMIMVRRLGQSGLHAWVDQKQRKVEAESDKRSDLR